MADDGVGDLDLGKSLRALWRRKFLFLVIMGAVAVPSAALLLAVPGQFVAEALIKVEPRAAMIVQIEPVSPTLPADVTSVETQSEILRSATLARKVLDRLQLWNDPEFNVALRERGHISGLLHSLAAPVSDLISEATTALRGSPGASSDMADPDALVVDDFRARLSVSPKGKSSIVAVSFRSSNPQKAALIANTVVELYLFEQAEAKREISRAAAKWIAGRLDELRGRVLDAERAVEQFREREGLSRARGDTVTDQQLVEFNTQLVTARAEYLRAAARLKQLQRSLRAGDGAATTPEALASPLIQKLRQQEAEVVRKLADLSAIYGNDHPRIINATAELHDLRNSISQELNKIVQAVANDVDVAQSREAALREALQKARGETGLVNQKEVGLQDLEREAEATRTLFTSLLARSEEIAAQMGLHAPDATIVAPARVPGQPAYPRRILIGAGILVGSVLLAFLTTLVLEIRGAGFTSREEVERLAGMPTLGIFPVVRRFGQLKRASGQAVVTSSDAVLREAVRSLFTNFAMPDLREPQRQVPLDRLGRTILVTSSIPGEGKSVFAASLARQAVRSNKRCLLVDCDFRRPKIDILMGRQNLPRPGLLQLLTGDAPWEDVIQTQEGSGLDFIASGSSPQALTDPSRFQTIKDIIPTILADGLGVILRRVQGMYDLVIIDSPPVMVIPDAVVLSRIVHETIFLVQWRKTRIDIAIAGLQRLLDAGAKVRGIVLTQVDTRLYAKYGLADSEIGSRLYRNYY